LRAAQITGVLSANAMRAREPAGSPAGASDSWGRSRSPGTSLLHRLLSMPAESRPRGESITTRAAGRARPGCGGRVVSGAGAADPVRPSRLRPVLLARPAVRSAGTAPGAARALRSCTKMRALSHRWEPPPLPPPIHP
jgi:hypothetical protein